MNKIVPFSGPEDAKIYIVGEAPGKTEEFEGKPFVGGSGRILNRMLMEVGLTREECRIANVMRVRPPANNFRHFYDGKYPKPELVEGRKFLIEDIKRCKPYVVCAMGNEPMKALIGEVGITNWRGSVVWSKKAQCKVLCTIHPANLMRNWDNLPLVMFDLRKLKQEAETRECETTTRSFVLAPTFEVCMRELDRIKKCKRIAFDVETPIGDTAMTAFAIADSPFSAISIPFTIFNGAPYWRFEEEWTILEKIKEIMEDESIEKIAQNAQFDILILRVNPPIIRVRNLVLDTMCAFHTIYPELPKALDVISSIYTRQPYYKHWAREGKDVVFWKYNATDACVTFEAAIQIEKEMEEFGVKDFYYELVHPLIPILMEMQLRGVKVNGKLREEAKGETERKVVTLQTALNEELERNINVASPKQLRELLFKDMKLPYRKVSKVTGIASTDEEVLQELARKFPSPIFDLILNIRQGNKLLSTYLTDEGAVDDRIRCSYVIGGTETGRLSSRESIFGSGTNLQNFPHGVCRRMLIADEGKVFVSPDLRQAEAMVVAYLSEEDRMIKVFEEGGDIHQLTADTLPPEFVPKGTAYEEVENPRRVFAKKHVHAFDYGESMRGFAREAGILEKEARVIRDAYFDNFPKVKAWHLSIQSQLSKSRTLTTPMGRKRTFFARWGDSLFREAYAHLPQSTVGDVLNLALQRTAKAVEKREMDAQIMLQVHDNFVVQVREDEVKRIVDIIRVAFYIPLFIKGREFVIPIEIKVGHNWEDMTEYGKQPKQPAKGK